MPPAYFHTAVKLCAPTHTRQMSSVSRCIALLGAVASIATARAVTEANAKATSAGFNTTRYNCTKELCPFSYTPPSGWDTPRPCGEINAAPRMPDDIWDDTNAVQEYVAAVINFYSTEPQDDATGLEVELLNSLCDHTGARASNKTQRAPWTSPDLMKYTCGAVCGCSYPACPDVPDDPRNHKFCSLCGPKFNQNITVTFWAAESRTQQWNFTLGQTTGDASPAVSTDGRTVFVGDFDTTLYAVATAESDRTSQKQRCIGPECAREDTDGVLRVHILCNNRCFCDARLLSAC